MRRRRFETTRWSLVLAAGDAAASPEAAEALESLCATYWAPVYGFIRARGHDTDAAADLTQAFFTEILDKHGLRAARRERGRFRSFLLTAAQHFLLNEYDKVRARKRGGDRERLPIDVADAESRYQLVAAAGTSPDVVFEREWAMSLLASALETVGGEYRELGKGPLFDTLRGALTGDGGQSQKVMAATLGMSEGAVAVALHRLRQRYARVLRGLILETVEDEAAAADELAFLLNVVSRGPS